MLVETRHRVDAIDGIDHLALPEREPIPVYDVRNLAHQELIAGQIAEGAQFAMFAGVWGGFKAVVNDTVEEKFFYEAKPGRPKVAKIAAVVPPSEAIRIVDFTKVHPELRFLENEEAFHGLWRDHLAHLHVIAPIRGDANFPPLFVTTPQEYSERFPDREPRNAATASIFWRKDPYLDRLLTLVNSASDKPMFIGGTSLNRHGEQPPFTYQDLVGHIRDGKVDPGAIHFIVRDSLEENSEAHGSHTQAMIPLAGEGEPIMRVSRIGTLSPEALEAAIGIRVHVLPDAVDVKRFPGKNIDQAIKDSHSRIMEAWGHTTAFTSG